MNLRNLVILTLYGLVLLAARSPSDLDKMCEHVEVQYSIAQSSMGLDNQGSIIFIAFEEFSATPTVNDPEDLTVQFDYPTNGGTGTASATLTCQSVEDIDLVGDYHIFECHLDGDIHAGDGELVPDIGRAVRVFAPLGWAQGGGDTSEEVNTADGDENLLFNVSEVANEMPTHHWDSRPFQIQTGNFQIDSIATHRYGIFKVEHRIAGVTGWTNATLTHKQGPTTDDPWIPVWRSTLDANAIADTFTGEVQVRVTPARGDTGSILTSATFDPAKGHHEWSHADFRHPHETSLPIILNADSTLQVTQIFAAVERNASGGMVKTTEGEALTSPFPTIEAAKLAIRDHRNTQGWGSNVTNGVIVLKAGTHFLGTEPQDHWTDGASTYVTNEAPLTIRAASGVDPDDAIITNCAFMVRIPAAKSPNSTGFIRITNPGQGNTVKLEIRPNSGVAIAEFPFGTGTGQYSTVSALVTAVNAAGYETVEVLTGMSTSKLKFRTWQFDNQDNDEATHFRFFEINRSPSGVNVRRLILKDLTTHTTQLLTATGTSKRALILDWTRHLSHAQGEHASEMVARSNTYHHGVWVYSGYFENLVTAGNGWTYARDCSFLRCTDSFKKCIAAVNPRFDDTGIITGQDTHSDLFQWFMAGTDPPPAPEDDPEDVAAVAETLVYNLLHLNGNASDVGIDSQPIFMTAGTAGTYQRVSFINYQWNETINREQAFKGNYKGLLLWHLSPLQGGVRKLLHEGFATTTSRYENLSIRNTACEVLHLSGRNQQGTALQGDMPSLWSVLNEVHIRSTLEDADGTLTITAYPDATTGASVDDLFTSPTTGDLSPDESRTTQPHLFDRPSNVPLLWPYDGKGTERISDGTGAIGALERKRLVDWSSFTITYGTHLSGGISQIETSDNAYLQFRSAGAGIGHDAEIELTGVTDVVSPRTMIVRIESRVTTAGTAKVKFKLPGTSTFVTVQQYSVGTTDGTQTFEVPDFDDYIATDGTVVMRILYNVPILPGSLGFDTSLDLAEVEIQ